MEAVQKSFTQLSTEMRKLQAADDAELGGSTGCEEGVGKVQRIGKGAMNERWNIMWQ